MPIQEVDLNIVIEIFMGIITTIMGIVIYVKREAFRSGSLETKTGDRVELNSSLITNAIKEIESAKKEVRSLSDQIVEEKIQRATLTERISHISQQLDDVMVQLQAFRSDQNRRDDWHNKSR